MPTVGLYTLGCKVSQYETEAIGEAFERRGYTVRPFEERNDIYVINTCTVTAESDRKSRQIIRRAVRTNPGAVVLVTGCYSQRAPQEVAALPGVSAVIGTQDKLSLVDRAEALRAGGDCPRWEVADVGQADFEPMCITRAPRTRAYVKIEDGCECRCTYCAISGARGRVRSKAPGDVIAEVEALARAGTREVVLTGIETGSYGVDFDAPYRLADLLVELDARASCERIRLGSLAPELIGAEFVSRVRSLTHLAPHFHLSMQSGSDAVLQRMRRRYSRARALENVARLREAIPGVTFTTDLMVGFPGESEEDFQATLSLVDEVRFLSCHVFAYSRRAGTPAADYPDQIPEGVKRERSERLIRHAQRVRDALLQEVVERGAPLSALFETEQDGVWSAHAPSFIELAVPSTEPLHGQVREVIPVSHRDGIVTARLI